MKKTENWINGLLIFLSIGSFILSFSGMYLVSIESYPVYLAWIWPLITEAAVVIFSLVYLDTKLKGDNNKFLMGIIIGCTILSVGFNVWHIEKELIKQLTVALPPIFLFIAFKSFIWRIEFLNTRNNLILAISDLESEKESLITENGELKNKSRQLKIQLKPTEKEIENKPNDIKEKVLKFLSVNPDATYEQIGQEVNRSVGSVSNYIGQLKKDGILTKNGQGYKVKN